LFLRYVLTNFTEAGLELMILLPPLPK
jgi:hypothetical protein